MKLKDELCGCGAKNGSEVDGEEFEIKTLKELIEMLRLYKEVHLAYFTGEKEDVDLWVKIA